MRNVRTARIRDLRLESRVGVHGLLRRGWFPLWFAGRAGLYWLLARGRQWKHLDTPSLFTDVAPYIEVKHFVDGDCPVIASDHLVRIARLGARASVCRHDGWSNQRRVT